ncbi:hypothetical protein GCM10010232_06730 [Streptomyces amakusaensis]
MITYCTWPGAMPARSTAAAMANPPRSEPEKEASEPRSRPIGVLAPATITEVVPVVPDIRHDPLPARGPRSERGFTSNVLSGPAGGHRAVGVIARTLRNGPIGAGL